MSTPVVIVGAGLAGLACARRLHRAKVPFLLLDADVRPGGRLKTDLVEGFRLDRGFQVHFTAYPAAREELDHEALNLRAFEAGALVVEGGDLHLIHREKPIQMALSGYLPLADKFRILDWTQEVQEMVQRELDALPDVTTEAFLRQRGFSEAFLERFARPFFGGIFLDRSLGVSARQFGFVWKMLSEGDTVIPALGMEEIPRQLAASLPPASLRMGTRVSEIIRDGERVVGVRTESGEAISAETVVIATEADVAAQLSGLPTVEGYRSSTCLYFDADEAPVDGRYLVLRGPGEGLVNEVVPMTNVAPELAPAGRHLVSVTLLGEPEGTEAELADAVKAEVRAWFPDRGVPTWRLLRVYRIRYAQMPQTPGVLPGLPGNRTPVEGLMFAGEFTVNSSIHGALRSGIEAARAILAGRREASLV